MPCSYFTNWAMVILTSTIALSLWPVPRAGLAAQEPIRAEIAIRARQFEPTSVSVAASHEVQLILRNEDAELHAFVPIRFLEHLPLHVDGNGAPQFGEKGLIRVLIPSGGHAEIRFAPATAGRYQCRRDLPGH